MQLTRSRGSPAVMTLAVFALIIASAVPRATRGETPPGLAKFSQAIPTAPSLTLNATLYSPALSGIDLGLAVARAAPATFGALLGDSSPFVASRPRRFERPRWRYLSVVNNTNLDSTARTTPARLLGSASWRRLDAS